MKPKIRLKGFEGDWENVKFPSLFTFLRNNTLSRACLTNNEGSVMNVHYGDVLIKFNDTLDVSKNEIPYIADESLGRDLLRNGALKDGDIVFADAAEDNTVGKCIEIINCDDNAIVSGLHTMPCRPNKHIARGLLGYYLNSKSYHDQLLPHIQGSKISSISKSALSKTKITLPTDSREQFGISEYFQKLDTLIQSTAKKIESLKKVKAACLQSMFPQEGETTPCVRFKGFDGEWVSCIVGELGNWEKGQGLSTSELTDSGAYACIHYGELFNYSECIQKVNSKCNLMSATLSSDNDILFPDSDVTPTGLGRCSALTQKGIILGGGINILHLKSKYFAPCVSYAINVNNKQIIERVTGTTVRHINAKSLSEVNIKLPKSIEEQQQIANYFTNLDKQIDLQTQRLEKLKQIKAACLDNMFV